MWLLASSCAFVTGVALAATNDVRWAAVLCPVLGFVFLLSRRTRATIALLVAAVAAFAYLGVIRYEASLPPPGTVLVSAWNGLGDVTLRAVVAEEPEQGGRYTQVRLDEVHIQQDGRFVHVEGMVMVTTSELRPLHYGDHVLLTSPLETPPVIEGFDYAAYLALQDIYSTTFCHSINVDPTERCQGLTSTLVALNTWLAKAMARSLPEPESSLAESLLLGRRGHMPDEVVDAFTRTGTVHLLSISGLHLAVVATAVLGLLLATAGRRHYLYVWLGLVAVWIYALFTGMNPPVARAAVMLSVFLLAELAGRQRHAPTALALAAAIMVGIEPRLLWQISFQLSILAMAGLVLLYEPVRTLLTRCIEPLLRRLRLPSIRLDAAIDISAATIAATIAVWPVSVATFSQTSAVAVPASLLTLPLLPFALAFASITAVFALCLPLLAAPFAWIAWLFLSCIINVVETFAAAPFATVGAHLSGEYAAPAYYAVLVALSVLWRLGGRRDDESRTAPPPTPIPHITRLQRVFASLLLLVALAWSALLSAPDGLLHVVFLDVGQGDAILIVTPTGRTVLVDGGPDGQRTCWLVDRHIPFWDRSLDAVVVTHPHADHLAGLLQAITRYRTGLVVQSPVVSKSLPAVEWERRLAESHATAMCATAGYELLLGDGATLSILSPAADMPSNAANAEDNNGLVLQLCYRDISFLLAADIRAEQEASLVHRGAMLRSNVLKVPHHGSSTSSSALFLTAVDPDAAVISVGVDNAYGHPNQAVVEALIASGAVVLTTSDCGSIEFVTDGQSLSVRTDRGPPAEPAGSQ